MIVLGAFLLAGCLAVHPESDQVTAADLAPAFPGMETVDPHTPLAFAPAPGVSRVFHAPELARLAERFHLSPPSPEICVTRPVAPLDREKVLAAMHRALPNAEIAVLDCSRAPVPAGDIYFPANQLRNEPSGQWWTGYVRYAGDHRFSIWARVEAQVTAALVVALRTVRPGEAIPPDAVQVQTHSSIPGNSGFAVSTDQVVNQSPRETIPAGTPIRLSLLTKPLDVARGDMVEVEAQSGAAHLQFTARAEESGVTGDEIPVLNPVSHRRFTARIAGKDRVSVDSLAAQDKP